MKTPLSHIKIKAKQILCRKPAGSLFSSHMVCSCGLSVWRTITDFLSPVCRRKVGSDIRKHATEYQGVSLLLSTMNFSLFLWSLIKGFFAFCLIYVCMYKSIYVCRTTTSPSFVAFEMFWKSKFSFVFLKLSFLACMIVEESLKIWSKYMSKGAGRQYVYHDYLQYVTCSANLWWTSVTNQPQIYSIFNRTLNWMYGVCPKTCPYPSGGVAVHLDQALYSLSV